MDDSMDAFVSYLRNEERSEATIYKYVRDVTSFRRWLGDRTISKELVCQWKEQLVQDGFRPVTVNVKLAAVHSWLSFIGEADCHAKYVRIQKQIFRKDERELTKTEYERLVNTATAHGRMRLALTIETICATGMRVSELRYITVEAVKSGSAEISLKGKDRIILLPKRLRTKLLQYAKEKNIVSGEIFITRNGTTLSRGQIWAEMKSICKEARVLATKVFPHNLRHLFARTYYRAHRDIAKLADILGHSSIETTRIYLISTGLEHARQIDKLGLVI